MELPNDHRIRVCHISTRFLRGGAPKNTILTIANLPPIKYRITLVAGRDMNREQMKNLPWIEIIQIPSMVRSIRPLKDLFCLWKLYRLFRERDFHIVHTHLAKAGILGRIAAKMAKVPVVIHSIHGSTFPPVIHPFLRWAYRVIERFAGAWTHRFIPVAQGLKDQYLSAGIGSESRYRIIHSGFDLACFRKTASEKNKERNRVRKDLGIAPDAVVIGYVANLEPRKGHIYTLEMMKSLVFRHPKAKLLLAGEGDYRGFLTDRIEEFGLRENVILLGYRTDIDRILCSFDVKVFTSLWEGLPQVLVQAAAMGIPIVSFDVDCVGEVVRGGRNGFLVPVGDVKALTEKVETLISDPVLRDRMGAEGRGLVDDSWKINSMVEATDHMYSETIREISPAALAGGFIRCGRVSGTP